MEREANLEQSREGRLEEGDAVEDAGASVDGGDEDQEGEYGEVSLAGLGLGRCEVGRGVREAIAPPPPTPLRRRIAVSHTLGHAIQPRYHNLRPVCDGREERSQLAYTG